MCLSSFVILLLFCFSAFRLTRFDELEFTTKPKHLNMYTFEKEKSEK